ncbi:MAG: hypothetical protein Q9218_007541 [Villophora microphyllina]
MPDITKKGPKAVEKTMKGPALANRMARDRYKIGLKAMYERSESKEKERSLLKMIPPEIQREIVRTNSTRCFRDLTALEYQFIDLTNKGTDKSLRKASTRRVTDAERLARLETQKKYQKKGNVVIYEIIPEILEKESKRYGPGRLTRKASTALSMAASPAVAGLDSDEEGNYGLEESQEPDSPKHPASSPQVLPWKRQKASTQEAEVRSEAIMVAGANRLGSSYGHARAPVIQGGRQWDEVIIDTRHQEALSTLQWNGRRLEDNTHNDGSGSNSQLLAPRFQGYDPSAFTPAEQQYSRNQARSYPQRGNPLTPDPFTPNEQQYPRDQAPTYPRRCGYVPYEARQDRSSNLFQTHTYSLDQPSSSMPGMRGSGMPANPRMFGSARQDRSGNAFQNPGYGFNQSFSSMPGTHGPSIPANPRMSGYQHHQPAQRFTAIEPVQQTLAEEDDSLVESSVLFGEDDMIDWDAFEAEQWNCYSPDT